MKLHKELPERNAKEKKAKKKGRDRIIAIDELISMLDCLRDVDLELHLETNDHVHHLGGLEHTTP